MATRPNPPNAVWVPYPDKKSKAELAKVPRLGRFIDTTTSGGAATADAVVTKAVQEFHARPYAERTMTVVAKQWVARTGVTPSHPAGLDLHSIQPQQEDPSTRKT
jgi:hypothetical protein